MWGTKKRVVQFSIQNVNGYKTLKSRTFSSHIGVGDEIFGEASKEKFLGRLRQSLERCQSPNIPHKRAAVLIPMLLHNGSPSLLFTLRSSDLRRHRGEVSFPGGLTDDVDSNPTETALREAYEEIGLSPSEVEIWTEMPCIYSRDRNIVTPVVGLIRQPNLNLLKLEKKEVEQVFCEKISVLCDHQRQRTTLFRNAKTLSKFSLPVYIGEHHRIWGLTAVITYQFLCGFLPQQHRLELNHKLPF